MKYPSELRADHRAATHRKLHCQRSAFQSALYATFPWDFAVPRPLSTRPMEFSIVRLILHVLGDLSKLGASGDVRHAKFHFRFHVDKNLAGRNYAFLGSLHGDGVEVTV